MFYIRPIARDDLRAIFALSERTGTGLTTLPANRDRLARRIERSLASFAGEADLADACYVFVLVDGASADRVVGNPKSPRSRRGWSTFVCSRHWGAP